jgi:hypothetical protein
VASAGGVGGSTTQVQYNNAGAFAGSANLTFNGTTLTAAGLSGPFNGTVGATLANTANLTTLTTSSTVTHNGGTANGVTYLNASKVLTSGSGLVFDGTNGRLGIGTTNPVEKLHLDNGASDCMVRVLGRSRNLYLGQDVNGALIYSDGVASMNFYTNATEKARLSSAGGFSVGTTSDPGAGAIYAVGNITAYFSDDRLKTRLGPIENALDKVGSLDTFYYEPNDLAQSLGYKPVREVGLSAQQVQVVMPEVVAPAPIDEQYLTVRYERLMALAFAAIKELKAEIETLKKGA